MHWSENSNLEGRIQLTSCLFCLYSAALLLLNEQQLYLFGQILTSQTGGQLYSDTSPYGECSRSWQTGPRCKQRQRVFYGSLLCCKQGRWTGSTNLDKFTLKVVDRPRWILKSQVVGKLELVHLKLYCSDKTYNLISY